MAIKLNFKSVVMIVVIICGITTKLCAGSAIPMWEFLSRSEKMSHLYTTFAKQVSDYCKANDDARLQSVAQCKRDLLTYGLERLQSFSDVRLDTMDPYQRGANDLIWEIIMKGHPIVKTSLQQNSPSSAAVILENTGPSTSTDSTSNNNKNYQKNPLFDGKDDDTGSSYAMDMDTEYGYFNNRRQQQKTIEIIYTNTNNNNNNSENEPINRIIQNENTDDSFRSEFNNNNKNFNFKNNNNNNNGIYNDEFLSSPYSSLSSSSFSSSLKNDNNDNDKQSQSLVTYLTGPMVVRVRPDGTPVEEDRNKPLPYDDDREIMQYGSLKIPSSIKQISELFSNYNQNNKKLLKSS